MELMPLIKSRIMMKCGMRALLRALHQTLKNPYLISLMKAITPTTKMGIYGLQVPNPENQADQTTTHMISDTI
jgi:hypothetical protein